MIIRSEERKVNNPGTRASLYLHRIKIVRPEARASLLAYAYLRGKPLTTIERPGSKPINRDRTVRIIKRFSESFDEKVFEAWLEPLAVQAQAAE